MNNKKKNKILGWAIAVSMLLFIIFGVLQYFESKVLELDSKWLIVSFIPIALALIYTGIIKSFEGLGVKFETNIAESVADFDIAGEIEALDSPDMAKSSLHILSQVNEQERRKVERLKFTILRRNYYDTGVIFEYLRLLPKLKYIEIVDTNGKFKYLIRASHFKRRSNNIENDNIINNEIYIEKINELIRSIERNTIQQSFPDIIDITLPINSSILDAYRVMESTNQGKLLSDQILPVINLSGSMIGFVSRRKIEINISKKVLEILDKK
jgi:hypothetical protein